MSGAPRGFADVLRRYRIAAGLTQEELAERSGLSARGISDLERGARVRPRRDTVEMLASALALVEHQRATLLDAARSRSPGDTAPGASRAALNLPMPPTTLIGRADDVRAVGRLLGRDEVRLVTLTGPGGVGKTRLAIEVASARSSDFPDGVFFVSLGALRDPDLVLSTIAHTVGLPDAGGDSVLPRLTAQLRSSRALLVVDNFEHLVPAAPVLSSMLAACPTLKTLATSRVRLRLSGEHEVRVAPLALPHVGRGAEPAEWPASPAVQLFFQRARSLDPGFDPAGALTSIIAEICVRLDGLPLAIELAAARSKHLTISELAERLEHGLGLLTNGPRDLPARQRTLQSTIGWSYDLLSTEEQRLFRWVAVFAGGWTLTDLEVLCGGPGGLPIDAIDGMATLIDSSLVRAERDVDRRTRYAMLETIHEFAEARLAESSEEDAVRRRHVAVMVDFARQAERGLQSDERTDWALRATVELDNVRAALRWALDHGVTEQALRIVGNLDWFWDAVGRDAEGLAWTRAALAHANADRANLGYARALYTAGAIAWNMADFDASERLLAEGVARLRVLDDRRSLGQAVREQALTALSRGDRARARDLARDAVDILESVDDPWNFGLVLFVHGETLSGVDDAAACQSYERSLAVFRSIEDPWGMAHAINGLGGLAMRAGDYATARPLMEQALALRRTINNLGSIATSLTSLGELARRQRDDLAATAYLDEGLAGFRQIGDAERVAWTLYNLGLVNAHLGQSEAAAAALSECLALRVEQGNPQPVASTIAAVAAVAVLQGEIGRAARLLGAAQGLRRSNDVAASRDEVSEEQSVLDAIHADLSPEEVEVELAHGRELVLREAIELAVDALTTPPPRNG